MKLSDVFYIPGRKAEQVVLLEQIIPQILAEVTRLGLSEPRYLAASYKADIGIVGIEAIVSDGIGVGLLPDDRSERLVCGRDRHWFHRTVKEALQLRDANTIEFRQIGKGRYRRV